MAKSDLEATVPFRLLSHSPYHILHFFRIAWPAECVLESTIARGMGMLVTGEGVSNGGFKTGKSNYKRFSITLIRMAMRPYRNHNGSFSQYMGPTFCLRDSSGSSFLLATAALPSLTCLGGWGLGALGRFGLAGDLKRERVHNHFKARRGITCETSVT